MSAGNVSANGRPIAKHVACGAVSRGLAALVASGVPAAKIAGVCEVNPRTIKNAISNDKGHLLEFDTIATIAREWPRFGDDVMLPAGLRCTSRAPVDGPDAEWLAKAAAFVAEFATAMADGHVDHLEVLRLAEHAKTLAPALDSFSERAARLRAA